MVVLGIDYGLSKVGVAVATGNLSEPLVVIRFSQTSELISNLQKIIEREHVEKIVVGLADGEMKEKTLQFISELTNKSNLPVVTFDETLTTKDAVNLAFDSGMKRIKRQEMEDAFAAAVMLQSYLDQNA